jgi:hypothetical protein
VTAVLRLVKQAPQVGTLIVFSLPLALITPFRFRIPCLRDRLKAGFQYNSDARDEEKHNNEKSNNECAMPSEASLEATSHIPSVR